MTDWIKAREAAAMALQARDGSYDPQEPLDPTFAYDVDAALTALEQNGWVCVPNGPSSKMYDGAFDTKLPLSLNDVPVIYDAMITAALKERT